MHFVSISFLTPRSRRHSVPGAERSQHWFLISLLTWIDDVRVTWSSTPQLRPANGILDADISLQFHRLLSPPWSSRKYFMLRWQYVVSSSTRIPAGILKLILQLYGWNSTLRAPCERVYSVQLCVDAFTYFQPICEPYCSRSVRNSSHFLSTN